jgi:hypothetical protein
MEYKSYKTKRLNGRLVHSVGRRTTGLIVRNSKIWFYIYWDDGHVHKVYVKAMKFIIKNRTLGFLNKKEQLIWKLKYFKGELE